MQPISNPGSRNGSPTLGGWKLAQDKANEAEALRRQLEERDRTVEQLQARLTQCSTELAQLRQSVHSSDWSLLPPSGSTSTSGAQPSAMPNKELWAEFVTWLRAHGVGSMEQLKAFLKLHVNERWLDEGEVHPSSGSAIRVDAGGSVGASGQIQPMAVSTSAASARTPCMVRLCRPGGCEVEPPVRAPLQCFGAMPVPVQPSLLLDGEQPPGDSIMQASPVKVEEDVSMASTATAKEILEMVAPTPAPPFLAPEEQEDEKAVPPLPHGLGLGAYLTPGGAPLPSH
eukprot:RCo054212